MSVAKNVTQPKPIETESPSFTSAELDILRDGLFFSCLISVIAAFVALFVYCLIRLRLSPTVGKRPMVILSLLVCICDGVYAAFNGATYFVTVEPPKGSPLCELLVWGYAFGSLLSLLMTCGIALHLRLVFISNNGASSRGLNVFNHFAFSFLYSFVIAAIPLFFGAYGWLSGEGTCWFIGDHSAAWQWLIYGHVSIGTVFCSYVVAAVIYKLHKHHNDGLTTNCSSGPRTDASSNDRTIQDGQSHSPTNSNNARRKFKSTAKIARRLVLYPAIIVITQGSLVVVETESLISGKMRFIPYLYEYIITGLQGVFSVLIFLCSKSVISTFKSELILPYVESYERQYCLPIPSNYAPSALNAHDSFGTSEIEERQRPSFLGKFCYSLCCWIVGSKRLVRNDNRERVVPGDIEMMNSPVQMNKF